MKKNFYISKQLLFLAVLLSAFGLGEAKGQQLGLANSNYAGTHSLYTNPASIADSRHAFYLHLISAEAGVTTNFLKFEAPVSLYQFIKEGAELQPEYLERINNGRTKFVAGALDVRGPSFMLRLSPLHSIAFTTRVRAGISTHNISENISQLFQVEQTKMDEIFNQASENNSLNFNADLISELGFSYARVFVNHDNHLIKGGFTIKKLAGLYSAHAIMEDARFVAKERPISGTNDYEYILDINSIRMKYGFLNEGALEDLESVNVMSLLTGRNSQGSGWGADLGLSYEYRPNSDRYRSVMDGQEVINEEKNKYKFRAGIALMDIGGIRYNNPVSVRGYDFERKNKTLNSDGFNGAESTEEFGEVLRETLGITDADKITSFRSGLPTALNLHVDYKIAGPLYTSATILQSLRGRSSIGMRQQSLVALVPRLEFKKFGLSVPLALQNNYSVFTAGAMVRLANVFVGSDNIGSFFDIGSPQGANVYAGIALLPILKRNKKDKDKDGVSNAKDKCKRKPGSLELMGCPDKDNDGVADGDDACPEIAGSSDQQGCPTPPAE